MSSTHRHASHRESGQPEFDTEALAQGQAPSRRMLKVGRAPRQRMSVDGSALLPGDEVVIRQRLQLLDDIPAVISTSYCPLWVAAGTRLESAEDDPGPWRHWPNVASMNSRAPSGRPNAAWDDSDPNNGGGFINRRRDDPDSAALQAQYVTRVRARVGDQVFERIEQSLTLGRNPRPLTDEETAILRVAVAPLLRDMDTTRHSRPDIRAEAHEDRGEEAVCAWIQEPGGHFGQGISVLLSCSPGDQLYFLAEQLQSWAGDVQVDPQRRPWPDCPDHPGTHPLEPETHDDVAVWCCPGTFRVVAEIGALGSPPGSGIPRFLDHDTE